ncbi:GAF domain-containing protein [Polaromonas hydrogenivorans]|uniref:histidine kinase n=1 Tax=Polaromonas hydrogenivorans TaxID=335476 RepID=A0AAU7LSD9_9BURK
MLSRLGLRSRLMLLVLAALVPVFSLFTCSAAKNQQAVLALARASLQSQALLAAAHQQRLVERVAQLLGDIASGPSIKDPRNRLCVQFLKNLQAQDPGYSNLGVADLDGQLSCDAVNSGAPVNLADRSFFRQVLGGQAFSVGDYVVSRSSGRPGMAFGVPVYSGEGVLNGVAFAGIAIQEFAGVLAAEPVVEGARLRVLDRNGIVLAAHPPAAGLAGSREPDAVVLGALRSLQPEVREAADAGGIEQVYAFAPVSGSQGGLFVAISVPRDVLTAAPRALLLADLAALLGVTAFGMACAWAMGKRLVVNPANAILAEANEIARGNLHARVTLGRWSQDEIGRLGLAFNRMAQSLQAQCSERDAALRQADTERAMRDLILNSMSEGVIAVDAGGRFMLFNAAARKIFCVPAADMLFDEWRKINPLRMLDGQIMASDGPLRQTLRGVSIDKLDLVFSSPDSQDRILRMSTRPLLGPQGQQIGALAVFIDVTQTKAAEHFALAQENVLILIAGGAALGESLEAIVRLIEKSAPQSLCSILMAEGGQLRHGIAPSLPPDFVRAIDGLPIAEGVGACGTAAFRKESVIIEDVTQDARMHDYQELLAAHGLRACWSTPVVAGDGKVLATFAIYRRAPGGPLPADLALIATATRLARLALERARVKAELIGSEENFRELAENIEDVFYNVDVHHGSPRLRYVSPRYEKVWGRSCESLYAAPVSRADAVLPEDRHVMVRADARNAAGQNASVEYRILSTDGRTRWIRDRSYPMFNATGEVVRVVGTARDITESKLAEIALVSTHRALQMLSRSSIAINRIHDEAGLLAEVCRVAVEVGGYRMAWVGYANDDEDKKIRPVAHAGSELGYLDVITLYWRDDLPGGQGPAGRAIRTGRPQQVSDISKPGSQFHWTDAAVQRGYHSVLMLPLCSEKRSFGVLCLYAGQVQEFAPEEVNLLQELADNLAFGIVSLRTRLERSQAREEVLQLNASLEERVEQRTAQLRFANQQLEAFSYSVSHDLRTPLSSIDGFSTLLEKSLTRPDSAPLTERSRHCLARIRSGARQMGDLIDAMLALAQVSRSSLAWEAVDLSTSAEALLSGLHEREPGRIARLQVEPGMRVQGDPRLLRQVLDNLLGNAWKFTSGKAETCITVGQMASGEGEKAYFVRDNGAGFDMAYVGKLFGAFQRLHTEAEFAGTGIGLATVQRIIARHGGRVWAESVQGEGATFYFTLGAAAA